MEQVLWSNQGLKVCVLVCASVADGQLTPEVVSSWTSVKWKQSTKVEYHFKTSPPAGGVCLLCSQRRCGIKCTSTNDNNTAGPFYFSKLRLRLRSAPPRPARRALIPPWRFFPSAFYHIKQISKMWFESGEKLTLKDARRRNARGREHTSSLGFLSRATTECV